MKKAFRDLRKRPLLKPLWLTGFVALAGVAILAWFVAGMTTTTVVLVRHAEKELGTIQDPPLSSAGEQRAQALARLFGIASGPGHIEAVYSSNTRHAVSTATPVAARLGVSVTVAPETAQVLRGIRHEHRGGMVLLVGHSNTVPEMVRQLSRRDDIPDMDENDYSTIYIVTVPTLGRPCVVRMSY